jgi:hypothetical protein
MKIVHSARPRLRHAQDGSAFTQENYPPNLASMTSCANVTQRNSLLGEPGGESEVVSCPCCGALVAADIDCAAEDCPGSPDQRLFAVYMSPYRTYRLGNYFDRDSIRANIEVGLRKATDYRGLVCRLSARGTLPDADAIARETLETIKRHANALARLDELDEQHAKGNCR